MMRAAPMEPLTVEDYRMMPETGPRYQLVEGELFMAPAPNRFHQDISGNIYFRQDDPDHPAATCVGKDTFSPPHFPGLKIRGARIFKR